MSAPKHTDKEYMDFLRRQEFFSVEGDNDYDGPPFSGIGERGLWEDGDTLEEVLDILISIEGDRDE